jgi:hypothetical protein
VELIGCKLLIPAFQVILRVSAIRWWITVPPRCGRHGWTGFFGDVAYASEQVAVLKV